MKIETINRHVSKTVTTYATAIFSAVGEKLVYPFFISWSIQWIARCELLCMPNVGSDVTSDMCLFFVCIETTQLSKFDFSKIILTHVFLRLEDFAVQVDVFSIMESACPLTHARKLLSLNVIHRSPLASEHCFLTGTSFRLFSNSRRFGFFTLKIPSSPPYFGKLSTLFKYLGTRLTNKNSIQEEIKSRLKSGHACYYSVQLFFLPICYPKI